MISQNYLSESMYYLHSHISNTNYNSLVVIPFTFFSYCHYHSTTTIIITSSLFSCHMHSCATSALSIVSITLLLSPSLDHWLCIHFPLAIFDTNLWGSSLLGETFLQCYSLTWWLHTSFPWQSINQWLHQPPSPLMPKLWLNHHWYIQISEPSSIPFPPYYFYNPPPL